ncbi:hypothetical protein GZH49_40080 [Nocardia terpenica]
MDRYYGQFNKSSQNRWVFGNRVSGLYLHKFAWTKIVRHVMVKGTASPDDSGLDRRRRMTTPLGRHTLRLLHQQAGRCPLCGDFLLHADRQPRSPTEWEQWIRTTRHAIRKRHIAIAGGLLGDTDDHQQIRLAHAHCLRRITVEKATSAGTSAPLAHNGLLEPRCPETGLSGVRRVALRYIPGAAGMDSEGGSWVAQLTWSRKVKGTRACRERGGRPEASGAGCRKTRTIWPRLDCLKPIPQR